MIPFLRLCAAALAVAASCGCGMFAPTGPAGGSRGEVVYSPVGWPVEVRADVFAPRPGPATPAVVLVHGGGMNFQDLRWQMRGLARRLADRGWFVLNITYRHPPGWTWPAPVDDVRAAVDWLETHAAGQNIDPSRIAVYGYSAGGHLALLQGLRDPRVKAVVAGAAPSDLMLFEGGRLVRDFLGGTRADVPERYRAASPVFHVTSESPPVFLYHGTRDELVPPIHAWMMKQELDAAGVPNELHWLEGKGHVSGFLLSGPAERRAMDFLERVFHSRGGAGPRSALDASSR